MGQGRNIRNNQLNSIKSEEQGKGTPRLHYLASDALGPVIKGVSEGWLVTESSKSLVCRPISGSAADAD